MSHDARRSLQAWITLWLGVVLWPVGGAGGAEPAWEFLAGLRQHGYHDAALWYLQRIGSDPQCPADLKETLDYQWGVTLADGLSRSASPAVQAAQLRQARARLEKFLEKRPRQHALTFEARRRLAGVLSDLGRLEAGMAAAVDESSPDRGRLLGSARGSFQAAQQTLETVEKELQDEAANYPPYLDEKDPRYAKRLDVQRRLMELPLEIAGAIDARAKTYRPAEKEYGSLRTAAADRYHRLYAKHLASYGGIYARMCEGRVLQELGRTSEAIEAFQDIWSQVSKAAPLRAIRGQTLALMLKTYSLPAVKRCPEALALAAAWQKTADQAEQTSPEGLEVHYEAGLAALAHARALAGSAVRREATLAAKSHFDFVAGHCGELQADAWERSAELAEGKRGQSPFAGTARRVLRTNGDCPLFPEGQPSFAMAKAAGDAAWRRMNSSRVKSQEAKTWQDHERYAAEADRAVHEAIEPYRRALAGWPVAANPTIPPRDGNGVRENRGPIADHGQSVSAGSLAPAPSRQQREPESAAFRTASEYLNQVRYRLAYLLFATGEYDEAGLMAEFLAEAYPDAADAREAAGIAAAAYRNLVVKRLQSVASGNGEPLSSEAICQATDSATQRLVHVGRFLIARWPQESEAVEAAKLLIDTAIDRRDATSASELLADLPAACPYRPQAELRVGQTWWETYVQAAPVVGEDRLPPERLRELAERAGTLLRQGIEHSQAARRQAVSADYALVYSAFALAQMAMDQGQAAEAVRWLDDPAIGPMTLLSSGGPVPDDLLAIRDQTLLLAVLADASARLPDKALDALARLDNRALKRADPLAGRQSARQCHLAGTRLGKVVRRLRQEGKADEVQQITIGEELLLGRIAQRGGLALRNDVGGGGPQEAPSFLMQVWGVETCLALGDDGPRPPPSSSEAATYLRRAVRTCLAILDRLRVAPSWGPPNAASDIQVRLAAALRAQGQFSQALERLAAVLGQEELRMDAQIEAARTFQAWGQEEPGCYLRAIHGESHPWRVAGGATRQVPLWGWEEIVRRLAPRPRYGEQLLDARYNLAVCRVKLAATQAEPSRGASLEKAADELAAIRGRLPREGSVWAARWDSLLKEIDVARKVKVSRK
jgi:hypothetical protein